MRSEIFASIKDNRKEYYRQLSNQNNLDKKIKVKRNDDTQKKTVHGKLNNRKPVNSSIYQIQSRFTASKNRMYLNSENIHLNDELKDKTLIYSRKSKELFTKVAGGTEEIIFIFLKGVLNPLFNKIKRTKVSISQRLNRSLDSLSNRSINGINNIGNYIFGEDGQPSQFSSDKYQNNNHLMQANTIDTGALNLAIDWPEKLKMILRDILIYLESDFFTFNIAKVEYNNEDHKKGLIQSRTVNFKSLLEIYQQILAKLSQFAKFVMGSPRIAINTSFYSHIISAMKVKYQSVKRHLVKLLHFINNKLL
ncbi:MAG: hypothetical protein JW731_02000 [Bacteroidales bacterium]|nr:hypothetical protein [Bacteroidales bacterium]